MIQYDFGPYISAFTSERNDVVSQDILLPKLTHSCHVEVVNERKAFFDADALITQVPGLWIGVYSADCVPVLIADKRQNVVAAVHAGWRGTVGGITRIAVERMKAEFGCRPEDMQAVIGPSISPEAFEVGEEVRLLFRQAAFPSSVVCLSCSECRPHIDLWQANQWLLTEAGIPASHIQLTGLCTHTLSDRFFSARREGYHTGRIITAICLQTVFP